MIVEWLIFIVTLLHATVSIGIYLHLRTLSGLPWSLFKQKDTDRYV